MKFGLVVEDQIVLKAIFHFIKHNFRKTRLRACTAFRFARGVRQGLPWVPEAFHAPFPVSVKS